jgi:hypothetical protein
MVHRSPPYMTLLVLSAIPSAARACGPGEAAVHSQRSRTTADFKVLVWYNRSDALGTFQYQMYDVRKGQYTAKVDDWIKNVEAKYPAYYVVVRDVDLSREQGKTEMLKVGAVVQRELIVAASFAGVVVGAGPSPFSPSSGFGLGQGAQNTGPGTGARLNRLPGSSGINRDFLNPLPTQFPVPVPYPRLPR